MVAPFSGQPARPILLTGEIRARGAVVPIFEGIVRAGWSGELAVDDPLVHRTFVLDRGAIVGARTSAAEERLGAIARKLGMLTAEQITTILDRHGERRFGEVAVELGMVSRDRVLEAIVQQAEEIVAGASGVAFGSFSFTEGFDAEDLGAWALDALEVLARVRGESPPSSRADGLPRYNEAIAAIFQTATTYGHASTLRTALASYALGNVVDRALFSTPRMYGTLDDADVDAALAGTPADRREDVLRTRLHDALQYALFVASAEIPREAERSLLSRIEPTLAALSVGRQSSTPIARVLLVRRAPDTRASQPSASAGNVALPERREIVPFRVSTLPAGGSPERLVTEPLPLLRASLPQATQREPDRRVVEEAPLSPPPLSPPRARSRMPLLLVGAALLIGVAFVLARFLAAPTLALSGPSSAPTAPLPTVSVPPTQATPPPLASLPQLPTVTPHPASTSTHGTIRTTDPGHHVWIDGRLAGDTPQSFQVPCGTHVVRVGVGGQPQLTDVPCGGEVVLGFQ